VFITFHSIQSTVTKGIKDLMIQRMARRNAIFRIYIQSVRAF